MEPWAGRRGGDARGEHGRGPDRVGLERVVGLGAGSRWCSLRAPNGWASWPPSPASRAGDGRRGRGRAHHGTARRSRAPSWWSPGLASAPRPTRPDPPSCPRGGRWRSRAGAPRGGARRGILARGWARRGGARHGVRPAFAGALEVSVGLARGGGTVGARQRRGACGRARGGASRGARRAPAGAASSASWCSAWAWWPSRTRSRSSAPWACTRAPIVVGLGVVVVGVWCSRWAASWWPSHDRAGEGVAPRAPRGRRGGARAGAPRRPWSWPSRGWGSPSSKRSRDHHDGQGGQGGQGGQRPPA